MSRYKLRLPRALVLLLAATMATAVTACGGMGVSDQALGTQAVTADLRSAIVLGSDREVSRYSPVKELLKAGFEPVELTYLVKTKEYTELEFKCTRAPKKHKCDYLSVNTARLGILPGTHTDDVIYKEGVKLPKDKDPEHNEDLRWLRFGFNADKKIAVYGYQYFCNGEFSGFTGSSLWALPEQVRLIAPGSADRINIGKSTYDCRVPEPQK